MDARWHASRRAAILKAHPEVRELLAPDARILVYACVLAVLNEGALWAMRTHLSPLVRYALLVAVMPIPVFSFILLVHEIVHCNASRSAAVNCAAQVAVTAYSAVPVRLYQLLHKMHHAHLNTELDLEWAVRSAPRAFRLLSWVCQPVGIGLYAVCHRRGVLRRAVRGNEGGLLASACVAIVGGAARVCLLGWSGLIEVYVAGLVAMGAHPVNARAVREHALSPPGGQPTMSSYAKSALAVSPGAMHVEHHDFPDVPSTRAHHLARVAPSFYAPLDATRSLRGELAAWIAGATRGAEAR
jgi:sphingolipid delta-4 desaturase